MRSASWRIWLFLAIPVALAGCGGGGTSGASGSSSSGSSTVTTSGSNVQTITVNSGPSSTYGPDFDYIDGAFTSVTVCSPGSTTNCQTVSGILVDTGSPGLRILSSALSISLPAQTNSGGSPMAECAAFADGVTWGPVNTADVKISGQVASSMPIQVIGSPSYSSVPADCSVQGATEDDLADLGANGILGIGQTVQDCGTACASSGPASEGTYYACPSTGCVDTTESLAAQVQNPVASFATDNNGVIIELPSVAGAQSTASGSLVFGIGTESNNGLGSATVFGTDAYGYFGSTYQSTNYSAILDSGSNAIYFLNPTTALPECVDATFWYCPTTAQTIGGTNVGTNGATGGFSFTVGNADNLTINPANAAVNGLAGPSPGLFDFGLPFFFGRNVFVAIEGKSTPGGTGPYSAY